jgi:hypothetical protein
MLLMRFAGRASFPSAQREMTFANWRENCESFTEPAPMPACRTSKALQPPPKCGDPMGAPDNPIWMSEPNVERYRATADECQTRARKARLVIDREAWLMLAADWHTLADDALRRRPDG